MGGSYSMEGQHEDAFFYKQESLSIKKIIYLEDNEDLAWSYDCLGIEYS